MSLSRPARFPLLKLPWLCIKCVMQNSDLFDIMYFATISNRTCRIVQHSKYPLKEIEVHLCWDREIYMGKTMGMAKDNKIWSFKNETYPFVGEFVLQKKVKPPLRNKQYIDRWGAHCLDSYTTGDKLDALKMGIDFLLDVFRCTIRKVFVDGDKLSELVGLGISDVKELLIRGAGPNTTADLKHLLETINVTDSYVFYCPIPANFYCDPQIFKCRQLFFSGENSADWVTLELLCQFDATQLSFWHHRFSVEDIVSYVTYWFNSENRKLESLFVSFKDTVSQDDFEIDHLNPMPFDEKRRNRYPFVGRWKGTSSGMDILRQDGLLATLFVKPDSILFYVWHKRFPDAVEHN